MLIRRLLALALLLVPAQASALATVAHPVQDTGRKCISRALVVLDPGHGGRDPGAIGGPNDLREKDVALAMALAIRDSLRAGRKVEVRLTRDDDRYLPLRGRFAVARRAHADLFLSLHADAAANRSAHGATVYTLDDGVSDREAALLAARENRSDLVVGTDFTHTPREVSSLVLDIVRSEKRNASVRFALLLIRDAAPSLTFRARAHRVASLMVLRALDIPSVLFEIGYISNPQDAARMVSAAGRRIVANAVARAIETWLDRHCSAVIGAKSIEKHDLR